MTDDRDDPEPTPPPDTPGSAAAPASETVVLLGSWHRGDRAALDRLLERDIAWVREHVRRRLGRLLTRKGEPDDYVHDALVQILDYVPRFMVSDRRQFRALLGRFCENAIRDRVEQFRTRKRDVAKERVIPSDSILHLDPTAKQVSRVSLTVDRRLDLDWLRLAIELLEPPSRRLVWMRNWGGMSFAEIAAELGVLEDAARMRYNRVLPHLAVAVEELRRGQLGRLLEHPPEAAGDADPAPPDPAVDLTASGVPDCWQLLAALPARAEARAAFRRLADRILGPAISSALRCRWGTAADDAALAAAAEDVLTRLQDGARAADAHDAGFAVFVEQQTEAHGAAAEAAGDRPPPLADRAQRQGAFHAAWAAHTLAAVSHAYGAQAADATRRFRFELFRKLTNEEFGLDALSERWSIPKDTLVAEFAATRSEMMAILVGFVRFCSPHQSRFEHEAEAHQLLALAAGGASPPA